jgi:hypothetical protein
LPAAFGSRPAISCHETEQEAEKDDPRLVGIGKFHRMLSWHVSHSEWLAHGESVPDRAL